VGIQEVHPERKIDDSTAHHAAVAPRPTFVVHLRPKPGIDPIRALRSALKILGRRFGLQATFSREEREP